MHAARLLCLGCGGFLSWVPYVARDSILSSAETAPGTIIEYPRFDKTLDGSFITNRIRPCSKCGSVLSSLRHERGVFCENCLAYHGAISEQSLRFLKCAVELFGPMTNSRSMPAIELHPRNPSLSHIPYPLSLPDDGASGSIMSSTQLMLQKHHQK
jgi:hypothetical protein